MTWIAGVPYEQAGVRLRRLYDRVAGPDGHVDNILRAHALRPHTLEGHLTLYKAVLHSAANTLPAWLLETVGVQVSLVNRCDYCVDHHVAGLGRLIGADGAGAIRVALEAGRVPDACGPRETAILAYTERLTREPGTMTVADVDTLRAAGLADGEILEVNQVAAYFAYANRTVLGLGVTTAGDTLGLSPRSDDDNDWTHG